MSRAPILINRTGSVSFGDASLAVWEDGISAARNAGGWEGAQAWELQFKREVFKRIVQTLNRLGWTVGPQHHIFTRNNARFCQKGDLKGDLQVSGRHIEFNMFQSVNCPTRADHEGRYEWNKEACMPYVVRLEMERTRRRIRDYLCNVFSGYTFDEKHRSIYRRPGLVQQTSAEWLANAYAESSHYKGTDWAKYLAKNHGLPYDRKSKDGALLDHGQRVWFADRSGRIVEGTAFYNINNMWWVVTGRYDHTNVASFDLYTRPPENIRVKRNERQRRKRLETLLADATKAMDFERASKLRDVLFPPSEALFMIQCRRDNLYFGPDYCGYTADAANAGKYTREELKPYLHGALETRDHRAVQIREAA